MFTWKFRHPTMGDAFLRSVVGKNVIYKNFTLSNKHFKKITDILIRYKDFGRQNETDEPNRTD